MQRRKFLKHLLAAPVAATTFIYGNPLRPRLRLAEAAANKTLVVIFQRGGCDGLNTVVPYGDDDYYRLRSSLAIAPPGTTNAAALRLDGFFGLHPALAPLQSIYGNGDLAVMPAVHYQSPSRSHFSGQKLIESGGPKRVTDGWLNRYLTTQLLGGALPAVSMGSTLAHALRGKAPIAVIKKLGNISLSDEASLDMRSRLQAVFEQPVATSETNRALLHESGQLALDTLNTFDEIGASSYTPANGAEYPGSLYGQQLRDIAQLIKQGVGLKIATVTSGGWDTHSKQGGATGTQSARLGDFSKGIKALYTDLGPAMNDVLILTMTEFGRTAKENASGGTDHGNASAWFAIGGNVKGGIHGAWPGLAPDQLYKERFLAHTIEMADVMGEVISKHLGDPGALSTALPGHSYQTVGFL